MTVNTSPHAQKIIEAKALGMSRAEIAEMLGLSPKRISHIAPIFGRAHKYSPEFKKQIVDEFVAGGAAINVIAARYNLTNAQVNGILSRAGAYAKREKPAGNVRSVPLVRMKQARPPKFKVTPFTPREANVVPLNIPFLDRQRDQCAYLYGDDPRTMTCCGLPAYGTTSWCEAHAQIVFKPAEARNRNPRPR